MMVCSDNAFAYLDEAKAEYQVFIHLHKYDNIDSMQLIQYGDRITEWRENTMYPDRHTPTSFFIP